MADVVREIMDTEPATVGPGHSRRGGPAACCASTSCPACRWSTRTAAASGSSPRPTSCSPDEQGDLHMPHYVELFGGIVFLEPLGRFEERAAQGVRLDGGGHDDRRPRSRSSPDATVREAARLIARVRHNRLPVVEHGRLVGRRHARRRARRARRDRRECSRAEPERALARVDLGAIERNCARLAASRRGALCAVVKADGYGHGARGRRARRWRAAPPGWRWRRRARPRELRAAGIDGPLLVMGALTRAELRVGARGAAPTSSPGRDEFVAAAAARASACTSSSTPGWAGSARATRRGARVRLAAAPERGRR